MKRRSSKVFAATLALLVCLNGMPLGALAAGEETVAALATEQPAEQEQSVDEQPAGEPSGEQEQSVEEETPDEEKQPVDGETPDGEGTTDDEQSVGEVTPDDEQPAEEDKSADDEQQSAEQKQLTEPEQTEESSAVVLSDAESVSNAPAEVQARAEQREYYVSQDGNDETGKGTVEEPFASLMKAVNEAADNSTIVLKSDITVNEQARISGKHLTITSEEGEIHTITRGENMNAASDSSRSWYNPAMIEATDKGSVTLQNVTLTDAGLHSCVDEDGIKISDSYFMQAKDKGNSDDPAVKEFDNRTCVQDAMIAAYGEGASIILGDKATLKDYGGMSAVRANGGATITMNNGSIICDETVTDRTKGKLKQETGAAGAVWLQSGTLTMEQGSKITNLVGRAVYNEHGEANIYGEISNITNDKDMWNYQEGVAIHVRDHGTATLYANSLINEIDTTNSQWSTVYLCTYGTSVIMESGAHITNINGTAFTAVGASKVTSDTPDAATPDDLKLTINGEIANVTGWAAIRLPDSDQLDCVIGKKADIHNNTTENGTFYVQGPGIKIDLYGKIHDNNQGIYMFPNYGGQTLTMHDGAEITNNTGDGVVLRRGTFTMEGGIISGNGGVGVNVEVGSIFNMQGGTISGNQNAGVAFTCNMGWAPTEYPRVTLTKGAISGNTMQVNGTPNPVDLVIKARNSDKSPKKEEAYSSVKRYMQIDESPEMVIDNEDIYLQKYDITLVRPAGDVQFGITSDQAVEAIQTASTAQGWDGDILAALWVHSDNHEAALRLSKPALMKADLPVYLAVMAVNEEGLPDETNPTVMFYGVDSQDGELLANVLGENENGYAVALVQPTENYGSMAITMPETLDEKQVDTSSNYTLAGSADYTLSDNLFGMMKTDGIETPTFTIYLDKNVTIDPDTVTLSSDIFTIKETTYDSNIHTLRVVCSLKDGWQNATDKVSTLQWTTVLPRTEFSTGDTLNVTGRFDGTAKSTAVNVLAAPDATLMVAGILIQTADITVYMGGHTDAVVDENGNIVTGAPAENAGFPEPGFRVKLPNGVTDATGIIFQEKGGTKTWGLQLYDEKNDDVYKIIPTGNQQDPLRVQFTDAQGDTVLSDAFNVGTAVNQELTMDLYKGSVGEVKAVTSDGNSYYVTVLPGTLKVRGTTGNVQYGDKMDADDQAPANRPAVKAAAGTDFHINGSDVLADAKFVQLLFDDVINTTPTQQDRLIQLAQRADKQLGAPAEGKVRNFTAKYLDLVDSSNGNAWVKASQDVTVCWPYPEGTDQNTEFTVLHFKDLHRDMAAGEVSGEIATCDVETMTGIVKTATHIEFKTSEFSPFALVWYTDKPAEDTKNDNEDNSSSATTQKTQTSQVAVSAKAPEAAPTAVIPQTSDNSQPALWAGLLVFSGAVLTALYLLKRRKQNREQ